MEFHNDAMVRFHKLYSKNEIKMNALFIQLELRPVTGDEKQFLTEFIEVMRPLSMALDILQGQNHVTAGYLLPTLFNLIEEWQQMNDMTFTSELKAALVNGVRTRFSMEFESRYFQVAAALHPKFYLYWMPAEQVNCVKDAVREVLSSAEYSKESSTRDKQGKYIHMYINYHCNSSLLLSYTDMSIFILAFYATIEKLCASLTKYYIW